MASNDHMELMWKKGWTYAICVIVYRKNGVRVWEDSSSGGLVNEIEGNCACSTPVTDESAFGCCVLEEKSINGWFAPPFSDYLDDLFNRPVDIQWLCVIKSNNSLHSRKYFHVNLYCNDQSNSRQDRNEYWNPTRFAGQPCKLLPKIITS